VRRHHAHERRVQEPGRDLPDEVHLEVVAAVHDEPVPEHEHEITRGDQERDPGRRPWSRTEQDDGRVDHQPVGQRVGDLAEVGLDPPAPRQVAVQLVGDPGGGEHESRPASFALPPSSRAAR
jgi:hypothetical protein